MGNPYITYVIHIVTTPEKLWEALTSPKALGQVYHENIDILI
jgi:uncharacterized protein YndB with AHSA1/START domain